MVSKSSVYSCGYVSLQGNGLNDGRNARRRVMAPRSIDAAFSQRLTGESASFRFPAASSCAGAKKTCATTASAHDAWRGIRNRRGGGPHFTALKRIQASAVQFLAA